jgi:inorganic triphosphatase YgiF
LRIEGALSTTTPPPAIEASAATPQEVELKLRAELPTLSRVLTHPALVALRDGPSHAETLISRYYDTPSCELRAAAVALRIRRSGQHWVQTAKGAGSAVAGLHQRPEFEWPLARPQLNHEALLTTPWKKLFASAGPQLRPQFTTTVQRTSQPLRFDDETRATLCLDAGTLTSHTRRAPIAEIEIELVSGDMRRICELAQALAVDLPVRAAHRSKAERGYALVTGEAMSPVRAQRVELAADASAAQALAAVGADCLQQIGGNIEGLAEGEDGEFVHQLRVGVRRLRSLFRLIDSAQAPPSVAALDAELKWISDVAGNARDCDVFAEQTLAEISHHLLDPGLRRDFGRLKARATRMRRSHYETLVSAVRSPRATRLLLAAGAVLTDIAALTGPLGAPSSARALAQATLEQRDRRLRKRGKHLRTLPVAQRHRARIAAKKLRYAAEFFAPLFRGKHSSSYVAALSRLQDSLGKLNDAATGERLLDELAPVHNATTVLAHSAGIARGWGTAQCAHELARLSKVWRNFRRHKPFWN